MAVLISLGKFSFLSHPACSAHWQTVFPLGRDQCHANTGLSPGVTLVSAVCPEVLGNHWLYHASPGPGEEKSAWWPHSRGRSRASCLWHGRAAPWLMGCILLHAGKVPVACLWLVTDCLGNACAGNGHQGSESRVLPAPEEQTSKPPLFSQTEQRPDFLGI